MINDILSFFRRKWIKRILVFSLGAIVLLIVVIMACNKIVDSSTQRFTFSDLQQIPHNKVGVVLGTSKTLGFRKPNLYFNYRINAATQLYKSGKVDFLIVSGDNSVPGYNEPRDMKEALVAAGIPEEKIFLDYAGFRTFDSMIRTKEIFSQSSFTVISQQFHNDRAIFIAKHEGMNVVGYNAQDVNTYHGFKTNLHESLARVKVFIDLYIIPAHPHFLGEKIEIK